MSDLESHPAASHRPIEIAEGIFWVGYYDPESRLSCNPYLIVDHAEAVLIDGGSRPDFSTVMRKILQAGVAPGRIHYLIYQHYDPDLCGSLPNLEEMIDRPDLKILSKSENNYFIKHYGCKSTLHCIDAMERTLTLASGRTLRFIPTPYAHSAGSFMTWDEQSQTLFTSDLFGGLRQCAASNTLSLHLPGACHTCTRERSRSPTDLCDLLNQPCPLAGIGHFHRQVMPSCAAVRFALSKVRAIHPRMVAPQHGSLLSNPADIALVLDKLLAMNDIGIDGVLMEPER
ncbi:MAG: MBL fold metallo-hydrolase [Magnetococcales bacterium]|nr:MBL fold metallo-hydrolase [Magnetococcales bacterium]